MSSYRTHTHEDSTYARCYAAIRCQFRLENWKNVTSRLLHSTKTSVALFRLAFPLKKKPSIIFRVSSRQQSIRIRSLIMKCVVYKVNKYINTSTFGWNSSACLFKISTCELVSTQVRALLIHSIECVQHLAGFKISHSLIVHK